MITTLKKGLFIFCLTLFCVGIAWVSVEPSVREIGRTTERELNVVLSSSFGSVLIEKGEQGKVLVAEGGTESDVSSKMNMDYSIRNRVGYLDLVLWEECKEEKGKRGSYSMRDFKSGKWYLKFSDAVPISFDLELGVGKGNFDLTGLQVSDFDLSTGASDVDLSFDQPNKSSMDNMNIESGVSKFTGRNLGNANFKRFHFHGGVGSYTLDFSGDLRHEADVDIEVGLGVLTIIVPSDVGARLSCEESWVSRLDCDRDFVRTSKDQYETDNYATASGKMNIRIDSGLGSIKIKRH